MSHIMDVSQIVCTWLYKVTVSNVKHEKSVSWSNVKEHEKSLHTLLVSHTFVLRMCFIASSEVVCCWLYTCGNTTFVRGNVTYAMRHMTCACRTVTYRQSYHICGLKSNFSMQNATFVRKKRLFCSKMGPLCAEMQLLRAQMRLLRVKLSQKIIEIF